LIWAMNTSGASLRACTSRTKMPTSPATNKSLTLSPEGTCHSRRAPPTAFTKSLQKCFVAGQNHELDDVARETEPQRIQGASFFVGS